MHSELLYDMATSSSVLAELSSQITKKKTKQKSLQSTEKPPYILISIV